MSSKLQVESFRFRILNSEIISAPQFSHAPDSVFRRRNPFATCNFELGTLLACAACFGKSDSPLAQGMNWGIFTLLGILAPVLGCFAFCFFRMIHKDEAAQKNNAPKNITEI